MIREALSAKRMAITGSTGFLGTALVERLLRAVPDCELVLLIRAGRSSTVERRAARELFKNDALDRLREEHGKEGFAELLERRVQVVQGDVSSDGLGLDEAGRAALDAAPEVAHVADNAVVTGTEVTTVPASSRRTSMGTSRAKPWSPSSASTSVNRGWPS